MSRKRRTRHVRLVYEFIKTQQQQNSVQMMCRLLGVARSGYYAWL